MKIYISFILTNSFGKIFMILTDCIATILIRKKKFLCKVITFMLTFNGLQDKSIYFSSILWMSKHFERNIIRSRWQRQTSFLKIAFFSVQGNQRDQLPAEAFSSDFHPQTFILDKRSITLWSCETLPHAVIDPFSPVSILERIVLYEIFMIPRCTKFTHVT